MNPIIDEIYRRGVVRDSTGREYELHAHIDQVEGKYLHGLISSDESVTTTLEVGCEYGLSSLYICEALRNRPGVSHTIVDPYEMTAGHGVGISNLEIAGIDFFDLIMEPSELALPKLLRERPASFDLVFIDGFHTFDQTILDLYYANRLIRVGGYIVVDDCNMASVSKAVSYYLNYPAYEHVKQIPVTPRNWKGYSAKIGRFLLVRPLAVALPMPLYDRFYLRIRYPRMVALRKVSDDNRDWGWFKGF